MKYLLTIISTVLSISLLTGIAYSEEFKEATWPYKKKGSVMEVNLNNKTFMLCEETIWLNIEPPFNERKPEDTIFVSTTGEDSPLSQLQDEDYVLAEGTRHLKTNKVIIDKITLLKPRKTKAPKKNQDIPIKKVDGVWQN